MTRKIAVRLIPALLLGFAGAAGASGFALQNQSGSGNGNAFAGAAAAAEDASTIFFNPAGMTYLPQGHNISLSATVLDRSIKFRDKGTNLAMLNGPFGVSNGGDGGGTAVLPHGYWAWSLRPDLWVGVGVGPTFGNVTEYKKSFIGRNAGYFAEIEHINVNPSLAYRVNDRLSLGFGINFTRAHVRFKQGFPNGTGNHMEVDSDGTWGYGGNFGILYQVSPSTRIGFSYRSGIDFNNLKGKQKMAMALPLPAGALFRNQNVKASGYETPASASLAVSQKLTDRWEMLGDITWTDWSVFKNLHLKTRGAGLVPSGTTITNLPYNFKDTWRIGLGANYQYDDAWKLRFGIAYDEAPVRKSSDRTMTLPDSDRFWLSFGAKYRLSEKSSIDFAYSHIFFKDAKTRRAVTGTPQIVSGEWTSNRADLLSVQYNLNF